MKPVLVIGSTCVDLILKIDHLPKTSENLHPTAQTMTIGGCAFNVANLLQMMQLPTTFVSPVGGGIYGDYVKKELVRMGFTIPVYLPESENGCCYCLVEASGERTFLSYHGIEYTFQKEWMKPFPACDYRMVYICGLELEEDTGINLIEYLEENRNLEVYFAPGPRGIRIKGDKLTRILLLSPVLHINEQEAMELSQCADVESAARALQTQTQNTVIITLGGKGAFCLEKDGTSYTVPGCEAVVIDTIGAGDSHIGAILGCLSLGKSMKNSIETANHISAAIVESMGSSLSQEDWSQKCADLF